MTRDFMSVCTRSGVSLAVFRNRNPVQVLRNRLPDGERVDLASAHMIEWVEWTGLWDEPVVVIEHLDRVRTLHDQTLREVLSRSLRPESTIREVRTGEWKEAAGGPFVTRHDVLANARLRWPNLGIRDVETSIACWIGVALHARA